MATVLTDNGEAFIVDKLDETLDTLCDYIGWGTGTGAVKGNSDLITAATEARVQGVQSQPSADVLRTVATITADGSKTISEAGLFVGAGSGSPPSGGTLVVHGDFSGIALVLNDQIEFTINLEIT